MQKRWRVLQPSFDQLVALGEDGPFHFITSTLLANRGISSVEQARHFLEPQWEGRIHDPFQFASMSRAVGRVFAAFENSECITVHGDYDADGVTGSAVVITALREIAKGLGKASDLIDFYIPHRDKEGYGLREQTVRLLEERGARLIITVDCGIACVSEIALAKERGIDTIVLDHHEFGEDLPEAHLIHPRLPGESYPYPHLAAVGVSWKFVCALVHEARVRGLEIPVGWEKWLLDLVSIATVTDMVPLIGENRVLLAYGLKVLNKTRRLGLRSLIEKAGQEMGKLSSESIAYSLGPRLNAAGRMDHALLALKLLLAETEEEAAMLAGEIEQHNRNRQKAVEKMMEQAEEILAQDHDSSAVTVVWNPTWSPALVGLVAGRYLERFGKPCIAIGKHGDNWVGSGRSIATYDITAAMHRAGEGILTRVGGHPQACGFSFIQDEYAARLAEVLKQDAAERLQSSDLVPELVIDAELKLDDVDWRLIESLERFEPHGVGNPRPLFQSSNVEIVSCDTVGQRQNHLRCTVSSPTGKVQKCIGFKLGSRLAEVRAGDRIDIVYGVDVNEWNGRREIQCKLVDFRKTD